MPELPEVETIARSLRPELTGRIIVSAQVLWLRTLDGISADQFNQRIAGQKILATGRRAKYLDIQLTDFHLFIHLRMSGDLIIKNPAYQPEKHDRLIWRLSDDRQLVFNDTRKFGRVWLTAHPDDVIGNLGPEPFDTEFTPQTLHSRLIERHRQIKPLLLDQSFLAGLGNIYTDEALHLAGVHPLRISDTISINEAVKLYEAIVTVLLAGIEHNGASIDWVYRGGNFQNFFRVYNREGQPCSVCGALIQKIIVGQRGTHFCPICQEKII
ncbi:MAG: bifunctional DNA-formamidopyrimidine glycosylase/DNA-(apurinic or apyrimidinic site) lyase [Chloroflexi bacterium]|nr:bifunctional DNA-formamidopyrimidine glycosylase/DNA-(apurinic or apyrimidinic site) lyase [Chloroflexota bacterium]